MRKRRVIIFDRDTIIWSMMKYFLSLRGEYEVISYPEPVTCPVWVDSASPPCDQPCADVMLCDLPQPRMNGYTLFLSQSGRGCRIPIENRVLTAGNVDQELMKNISDLHCGFFPKPLNFNMIATWFNKREQGFDLRVPLLLRRREDRVASAEAVTCTVPPKTPLGRGVTVNKSYSGLCIRTDFPLHYEQIITVNFDARPLDARVSSVRWSKSVGSNSYLSGLQYWQS